MIGAPIGAVPIGGVLGGTDPSVVSPVARLLSGDIRDLEHLMHIRPMKPDGTRADIYVSSGWFASGPGDTFPTGTSLPHQLFDGLLVSPPHTETRAVIDGLVSASSVPTYGEARLADTRREKLDWLGYVWEGAPFTRYMGDPSWSFSSFATTGKGEVARLSGDTTSFSLALRDVINRLQKEIQPRRFLGFAACGRGDGVDDWGTCTLTCPAGSMTIEVRVKPKTSASTTKCICGWQHEATPGSFPGQRLLFFNTGATNNLTWRIRNDAGTAFNCVSANLPTTAWARVSCVLDFTAMKTRLYINGLLSQETTITGTFNTVWTQFDILRQPENPSLYWDGEIDDLRIWTTARTVDQILALMDRPLLGDESGLYSYWKFDEATGTSAFNSVATRPTLTLSGVTWTDSLTGGKEIQGKCPPKGGGILARWPLVLLSAVDQIYMVVDGSFVDILSDAAGRLIEVRGLRSFVYDGDVADPYTTTPASGHCVSIKSMGLMRFGSKPDGDVFVTVQVTSSTDVGSLIQSLYETEGGLSSSEVDEGACTTLGTAQPAQVGWGTRLDPETVDAVGVRMLQGVGAWRTTDLEGRVTVQRLEAPSTEVASLSSDDIQLDGVQPLSTLPAAAAITVSFKKYWQTLDASSLSSSLSLSEIADWSQEFRTYTTPRSSTILAANASAPTYSVETPFYKEQDARSEADRLVAYRAVARRTDRLPLTVSSHQYKVGQAVRITGPFLDYDDGKLVVITSKKADDGTGIHEIEVTGEVAA